MNLHPSIRAYFDANKSLEGGAPLHVSALPLPLRLGAAGAKWPCHAGDQRGAERVAR